jgi:hypothetical protein
MAQTMRYLRAGDWVRTASGDEGQVDLLSRLSAFIDFGSKPHSGPRSYLQSELTRIDRPQPEKISAVPQQ